MPICIELFAEFAKVEDVVRLGEGSVRTNPYGGEATTSLMVRTNWRVTLADCYNNGQGWEKDRETGQNSCSATMTATDPANSRKKAKI